VSESNHRQSKRTTPRRLSRAEQARVRYMAQAPNRPTPHPAPAPAARTKRALVAAVALLYLLVFISLGLNFLLIRELLATRDQVYDAVDDIVARVVTMTNDIENEVIAVPIQIEEEFPVSVSVPFKYDDVFPIDMEVPIKTTFSVPFEVMDTTINLDVPIDISVPIHYEVPISLQKTFDISTTVPVQFDLSVTIDLKDTPLPKYMEELRGAAKGIQAQIQATPITP
jgi:hypothetical protein